MPTPEQLAADAAESFVPADPPATLGLNVLVERLVELKSQLDAIDQHRKGVQQDYDALRKTYLPHVLSDNGWINVRTPLGTLSLRTKTYASVPKDQREAFWAWCQANGFAALAVEPAAVLGIYNALVERGEPAPDCIRTYHETVAVLTRKKE